MRPEESMEKARVYRASRARTGGHTLGDETGRARVEALSIPDEVIISKFLAPYRAKTRQAYAATLYAWLGFCVAARLHILQAERVHIEQWVKLLAAQGNSQTTIGTKLVPVCGLYRWAHQEGLTATDAAQYVRRPSRPRRSNLKWLDRDQFNRLLAASVQAGPPASGLVHLLGLNGLRLTETLDARIEHLGTQDGLTTLRLPNRKGGVMDVVSLPSATVAAIQGSIGDRVKGRILGTRQLTPAAVYGILDVLSDVAGLEFHARPHMLRATFVTLSLDAGIPARDIIASAGWVSPQMLGYYRAHAAIRRNASHRLTQYLDVKDTL